MKKVLSVLLAAIFIYSFLPGNTKNVNAQEKIYNVVSLCAKENPYKTVFSGTAQGVSDYFQKSGWTDGLPVNPPTDLKIKDYLRYTPYNAEDIIVNGYSAYTVAANAIAAGCPPEFMPICVAIAKAADNAALAKELADSHGRVPYAWINGPLARQLAIDYDQGMITNTNNVAIGRFIDFACMNLGGLNVSGKNNSTFGAPAAYFFAEDEEACIGMGWKPYHTAEGMNVNDNAITISTTLSWGNNITPATDDGEITASLIAWDITEKGSLAVGSGEKHGYRTLFITEAVAKNLSEKYPSKSELEDELINLAIRPLSLRAYATYFANPVAGSLKEKSLKDHYDYLAKAENAFLAKVPDWYRKLLPGVEKMMVVKTMEKGKTRIIVAGDRTRNKVQTMSGGSTVTVKIELPENWDELLDALNQKPYYNFEPIKTYYLE